MAISPKKTKTSSVQRRTHLRVSSRLARPSKRLKQLQKSERIQQLQSSARQRQHQSDTIAEASSDPAMATSKSTMETALSRSAHTKKQKGMSRPSFRKTGRVIIRLPPSHVRDAMQFIPIEDILENLIAKNHGEIPNEEDIATVATYYFVDVCSTYPASLIRFAATVLFRHFEPILERTTPSYKAYEMLKAKTQFVKAMRALRAEVAWGFVRTGKADLWMHKGL
ncbi:hypothetical protein B0H65DRAFT_422660 [Neurospora tetraspora]|uniref:Uncharacterized protein n=1 Tax=Neurospora tetraspora TaxID=94610 RepID=A0AAE0MSY6_9PEZI|nr:hypothetical protein B0H65DRAFT_422660 [Neurospora tetraspora]